LCSCCRPSYCRVYDNKNYFQVSTSSSSRWNSESRLARSSSASAGSFSELEPRPPTDHIPYPQKAESFAPPSYYKPQRIRTTRTPTASMAILNSVSARGAGGKDGSPAAVWTWAMILAATTTTALVVRRRRRRRQVEDARINKEVVCDQEEELLDLYDYNPGTSSLDKRGMTAVDRLPETFPASAPNRKKNEQTDHSNDGTEQTGESSLNSILLESFRTERFEV